MKNEEIEEKERGTRAQTPENIRAHSRGRWGAAAAAAARGTVATQ
jgi:hypothetical protein